MGSSCSSRQSGKDSASVKSDDSQDEQTEHEATPHNQSKKNSNGEKGKAKDKTALRLIEPDYSSGGDEGAGVGTPMSSISACAANGSTKGKPPEKTDGKVCEELPDLTLLKEETSSIVRGNIHEGKQLKRGNKICVVILGRLDDTGEHTRAMMNSLSMELAEQMDEKEMEIVVLNPHMCVPFLSASHSPSDLLSQYLAGQSSFSYIFVFLLRGTNLEMRELPASLSETNFTDITASLGEKEKELLRKWFIQDAYNSSLRRFRPPQQVFEGLLSNNAGEFDKACASWHLEHNRILDVLSSACSADQSKFRLKTVIEKDLQWIQQMDNDFPLKAILIRKDAKKTPVEDKMDQFLENITTNEKLRETARQIFQEKHTAFDILRPKISAEENSEDWWKEITSIMKSTVKECIEASPSSPGSQIADPLEDGIKTKVLEEISCHHHFTLQNLLKKYQGLDEYLNQIQKYLTSPARNAMLVIGANGSGKSSLTSLAATQCLKWNPEACVMTRYVGLTNNSTTTEGLLYYLVEHTIITHGQPSSYICTDMFYSLRNLWKKATSSRPIIVVIDGIDQATTAWSDLLDLVTELPEHVKVILTAQDSSSLRDEFIKRVQNEECLLKIDNPSSENCKNLLKHFMLNNDQNLSDSVWEKVQRIHQSPFAPLYLLILSQLIFVGAKEDENFGSNLEEEVQFFLNKLRNLYREGFLESVLGCLSLSPGGLLEQEILSVISSTQSSAGHNAVLDWLYLQKILSPFLKKRRENGLMLVAFSSPFLRETVLKYLLETEDKLNKCREIFKKHITKNEEKRILELSLSEEQKRSLIHMRALHGILLVMEKKHEEDIFFNFYWLFKMVQISGPFKVLEEMDLALHKHLQNRELLILREVIHLSSSSLVYDPSQFFSQIYGRLKWRLCQEENCARLSNLLAYASKSPLPCLLPIFSCLSGVRQDKSIPKEEKTTTYIDSIFRIPGNPHHVIAISTNRSQVTVWNIFTMEIVRTLTGINQPRNLEMIDDFKCLLLCGRELRIYNLNEGTFLMKLREVMNQKSPFFGLHDSDHVVALSRSRMYVNMMNLTEGNCVTTFKVGEDRFLNSLLVSQNGKICVCGDDSQKPSALLVWDLQRRKLMYDLRIPHHEFATRLAAITTEGHYVCCVCKELDEPAPNFIVVYDLQSGTLFKRWKPEVNTISITISTKGTCVIVGLEDSSVMAFDLITGNRRWTVFGHTYPPDTFRLDHKGLVLLSYDSQGKDQSLRVWDVPTGKSLATLTPDQKISTCEITCNGKAVVLSLEGLDAIFTFLLLHKEGPMKVMEHTVSYGEDQHKGKVIDFSRT